MKVMVIVHATKNSEAELSPGDEKMLAEMLKYNEQLVNAGVMLAGEGLRPSREGKRLVFASAGKKVIDGPFAETKELIAGYWIWNVRSMEHALEWANKCPNPMPGEEGVLELRPIYESEDFADADPTGKIREKEEELRKRIAK